MYLTLWKNIGKLLESSPLCNYHILWITIGVRDQALDWMTAPPVHVLSYLVLGSEKDAKSREVSTQAR